MLQHYCMIVKLCERYYGYPTRMENIAYFRCYHTENIVPGA